MSNAFLLGYMSDCRALVLDELKRIIPARSDVKSVLYDLVFEYPLRDAKALRPALCIATCRALGGPLADIANTAAVIELFHNAFLIHDDIEDGSEKRRAGITLHREFGVPIAINVGDAMFALTLEPLLDNTRILDLGKALRILQVVSTMVRESSEGQALELRWIRDNTWALSDRDYLRMVHKKTSHYTFITPVVVGAIAAGASSETIVRLRMFATALGTAFQIQDDILNLAGDEELIGKEIAGDLWEGKHTLVLLHALRSSGQQERKHAMAILAKRRPGAESLPDRVMPVRELTRRLMADGALSADAFAALDGALMALGGGDLRTSADVQFLRGIIERHQSIEYARSVAVRRAKRAQAVLAKLSDGWPRSAHREFLSAVAGFIIERDH